MHLLASCRSPFAALFILCVALSAILRAAPAAPDPALAAWVTRFEQYAVQPGLEHDRPYSGGKPPVLTLAQLLQQLPSPEKWPAVQATVDAALAAKPAGPERERLRAAHWLLAYLRNDRATLADELTAAAPAPDSPVAGALQAMRAALRPEAAASGESLARFEQQLAELEPVVEADVRRLLGDETNFARLERLIAVSKEFNEAMRGVYQEYERIKDDAKAQAAAEAAQKTFGEKMKADGEALGKLLEEPLVQRYARSQMMGVRPRDFAATLVVPDLVTLAGADQAAALVRRAFRVPAALSYGSDVSEETRALVRTLALEEVALVQVPSWGLAAERNGIALFEALRARFPDPGPDAYDYEKAASYYLADLIDRERVAEAVALASASASKGELRLPYEVMGALEQGGHAGALWGFLREWLAKFPGADEWDRFNRLSVQLGHQAELKELIKRLANDGSLQGMDRLKVQVLQADVELATGQFDAAVTRLTPLVAVPGHERPERGQQATIVTKLLRLAGLRERADDFAAALRSGEALIASQPDAEEAYGYSATFASILNEFGRFEDAARVAAAALHRAEAAAAVPVPSAPPTDPAEIASRPSPYELRRLLAERLRAEVELGHWKEARQLVEQSPFWNARDLIELMQETVASDHRPLAYYFARVALHGRDDRKARRVLEYGLVAEPGADSLYESYLHLVGQEARPLLEKLERSDRYQERPLIWRARLELDAKKWKAATATLQAAITVDPSDGEEGRGDRMRVYAFLAEALAAQGDRGKAEFFRGVVKAIRLSETADRWFECGAYDQAIALYRQSLGFFADAYCIQSRLAVRLAGEGKIDEAAEHYRKAFELMPDSFGRVESHCFGCEHVFAGKASQGVAETVFARLLAARPDKPQLHYLMGYLRDQQERYTEAAEHYRRAVALDPLYLNAWDRLSGLERHVKFSASERDDLLLKLNELDPLRRHASPDLGRVSDLPRLWRATRGEMDLPWTDSVWPLPPAQTPAPEWNFTSIAWKPRQSEFGAIVAQHPFVDAVRELLVRLNPSEPASEASH